MTHPSDGGTQPPDGQPGQTPPVDPVAPPQAVAPPSEPAAGETGPPVAASAAATPPGSAPDEPSPVAPGEPHPTAPTPDQPVPPQPYPGQPYPGQPVSGQPYPGQPVSGQPHPGAAAFPPPGFPPGYPTPQAPKKRRGLLIASIVLAVVLLLCAVGGIGAFMVLRKAENGEGAAEPVAAVDNFLRAVYQDRDAEKAASMVCSEARDQAEITKKVDEVKGYAQTYKSPRFRWEPPKVDEQNAERAVVSATLTMITGDEKTAEQPLRFTVVQKTGWWICEVG